MFQVPPLATYREAPNGPDVVVSAQRGAGETFQYNAESAGRDVEVAELDPDTIGIRHPVWAVFQINVGDEMLPASLIRSETVVETVECGDGQMCLLD
jgi:hypothetical protein